MTFDIFVDIQQLVLTASTTTQYVHSFVKNQNKFQAFQPEHGSFTHWFTLLTDEYHSVTVTDVQKPDSNTTYDHIT